MFEDFIFELEKYSKNAQIALTEFEGKVDGLSESLNPDEIQVLKKIFTDTCESLQGILGVLDGTNSPLAEIANRLGPTLLGINKSDFSKLVYSERKLLERMGLSESSIQITLDEMEVLKEKLILANSVLSTEEVINSVKNFKEIVCEISNISEEYEKAISLSMVKVCTKGLINVCVVTGDILSVFTVPDPTPFTFLRSVKSVYSGVKSLIKNTEELREQFHSLKESIDDSLKTNAEEVQEGVQESTEGDNKHSRFKKFLENNHLKKNKDD